MWNPKVELIGKASKIAKEKHPNGFNKSQLIQASKEVYGGRAVSHKKIESEQDICDQRSAMVNIDGHYPAGITDCYVVGINGDCGIDCPVFLRGDCNELEDLLEIAKEELDGDEYERVSEYYNPPKPNK